MDIIELVQSKERCREGEGGRGWETYPTKLGRMVQLLALVRIAVLFLSASARLGKATKKGPVSNAKVRKSVSIYEAVKCREVVLV